MNSFVIDAIARGGYLGIFVLMALENIFPPLPSEVIMGMGGHLVEQGQMAFWPLLIVGTIGTTAGNYFWYWIGARWGYRWLEPFVNRWGRWLTVDMDEVDRASRLFRRYGEVIVFFFRFFPLMRTMISLPAGLAQMNVWRFLLFTFAGSAIWNAALILAGKWASGSLENFEQYAGYAVLAMLGVAFVAYIYRVITWRPKDRTGE